MGSDTSTQTIIKDNPETTKALTDLTSKVMSMMSQFQSSNNKINQLRLENEKKIHDLSKQYEKKVQQLNKLKDPQQVEKAEQEIFTNFVNQLKQFKMVNPIPKNQGYRYIAIIGENAAGKSSMLNKILGLNLETGVDDTTQNIQRVSQDPQKRLVYFDSPGLNQTFNITHTEYLKAFYTIDCMFIATAVTFKNSIRTIQVMDKINPPQLYLIRNQCDLFKTEKEFQSAVIKDKALLAQYNIKNVTKVLYVSSIKQDDYRDNAQFKKIMKGG